MRSLEEACEDPTPAVRSGMVTQGLSMLGAKKGDFGAFYRAGKHPWGDVNVWGGWKRRALLTGTPGLAGDQGKETVRGAPNPGGAFIEGVGRILHPQAFISTLLGHGGAW